jgi:hypothetical protein
MAIGLATGHARSRAVVRVAASAERRLGGRPVKRMAIWLTRSRTAWRATSATAAELVAGASSRAATPGDLSRGGRPAPPILDEPHLIAPGASATTLRRPPSAGS